MAFGPIIIISNLTVQFDRIPTMTTNQLPQTGGGGTAGGGVMDFVVLLISIAVEMEPGWQMVELRGVT